MNDSNYMKIIRMWTAVEETNMKAILAFMNITELVVKIQPETMTVQYQWSWVQILYQPEFFSGLIFTTSSVVFITARITFIFLYVELFIKKTCCYTLCPSVVNRTALIFLAKLRVVTWSIKKQTQNDNGTEKMKLLLSRDDSSTGKRVFSNMWLLNSENKHGIVSNKLHNLW